ncbi:nucleoside deaminase [uncultured Thalassospira sp.]|uniref:nucleoside deaminase n=1 Tax=uncultured Thalassospira sp. TaxID=404382 RepID=UPI0030D9C365
MCDNTHHKHMRHAIELSRQKMEEGCGGPFGAVIVRDDKVIAEGWNKVTSSMDPTAHAEVSAIRAACEALGDFNLAGCEIYTSCEPCPMCLSAIYWARIDHIYYANGREDAAAIGFDDQFLYDEVAKPVSQRQLPCEHFKMEEAAEVFAQWAAKEDKIAY